MRPGSDFGTERDRICKGVLLTVSLRLISVQLGRETYISACWRSWFPHIFQLSGDVCKLVGCLSRHGRHGVAVALSAQLPTQGGAAWAPPVGRQAPSTHSQHQSTYSQHTVNIQSTCSQHNLFSVRCAVGFPINPARGRLKQYYNIIIYCCDLS